MDLNVKRIYDEPAVEDGTRILVDGLWPRGMKKEDAPMAPVVEGSCSERDHSERVPRRRRLGIFR